MEKSNKIIIGAVAVVLVVSVAVLAGQSQLFQGRMFKFSETPTDCSKLYLYNGKIVSAVTSPVTSSVPSAVVSDVTSTGGTSRVATAVTSPVTSSVASAVAVDKKTASKVDALKLKNLTESTLKSLGKKDYKKNSNLFTEGSQKDCLKDIRPAR